MPRKYTKKTDLVKSFFRNITVEPVTLLVCMSLGSFYILSPEIMIQKVCRVNMQLNKTVCDEIQKHDELQVLVQKKVSTLQIWHNVLMAVPSAIFMLFAGSWSDVHGRRFIMLSSLFGWALCYMCLIINTIWFEELRAEFLLIDVIQNCFGGMACFFMAINAYLADVTDPKGSRTRRMGFLPGLWAVGNNIGKALGSVVKAKLGFVYAFALGLAFNVLAMLYVLCFLKDSIAIRNHRLKKRLAAEEEVMDVQEVEAIKDLLSKDNQVTVFNRLKSFFSLANVKEGMSALGRKREDNMRVYLFMMIFSLEMESFINSGEWSNAYLYFRRKFQWGLNDFTMYTTFVGCIGIVSQYTLIPILSSKKVGLRDSTISAMDMTGCFIQTLIVAFTPKEWALYLAAVISILDYSSFAMLRSMISKVVRPDEVGKIFAAASSIQAFIPMVASPIFGTIYRSTVDFFPQTHLCIIAGLFVVNFANLITIDRHLSKLEKTKNLPKVIREEDIETEPNPEQGNKEEAVARSALMEGTNDHDAIELSVTAVITSKESTV